VSINTGTLMIRVMLLQWLVVSATYANDNQLAHRLYQEGKYAQAAEIFTDPAWKGVAMYRSEQWWRAAEAFVRADDAQSHYNLGNCYIKLSYYELALEAYQRAISLDPNHEDAKFNADIVLALLENDDEPQDGAGLLQPKELDRIESDNDEKSGKASGGEKDDNSGDSNKKEKDRDGTESADETIEKADQGKTGNSTEQSKKDPGNNGTSEVKGINDQHQEKAQASGKSDSEQTTDESQAAGLRNKIKYSTTQSVFYKSASS